MAERMSRQHVIPRLSSLVGHRGRSIVHTAAWSLVAKLASAANLVVAVPFVLRTLGPEEFGAWATLVSLVYFAGFLDFGFGNGTMNLVAAARGRGATEEIAAILHESRRVLAKVGACLALVVLISLPLVPWYHLLGMPVEMARDCRLASAAVLFSIVVAVPLNLANPVQLGLGHGERAFRWQAAGQLLALVAVVSMSFVGAGLTALTLAAVSTPLLASACNTLSLWRDPAIRSSARLSRQVDVAARIRHEGSLFFVMQLAAALAFSADLPLISALRDPTQAGVYAIVQRLFSVIPIGLSLVWAPLWPIYRQALASGDHKWVLRTLRRSLLLSVIVSTIAALVLGFGYDRIIKFWLHHPQAVSGSLLAGFAIWSVIHAIGSSIATFFNAASIMRYQIIVALIFAFGCLTAKILVVTRFGASALPWATIVTYSLASLLPTWLFWSRLKRAALSKQY
jgi:O-antigen/teichoic acid export membrane protein